MKGGRGWEREGRRSDREVEGRRGERVRGKEGKKTIPPPFLSQFKP